MNSLALVNNATHISEVGRIMNFNAEQIQLAKLINEQVNQYPDTTLGTENLLTNMYDYMADFQRLLDSTTGVQMDYLCQQYPGVYRLGRLLESLADAIETGAIDVPKDH